MTDMQTLFNELPIPYITIIISTSLIILKGVNLLFTSNVEKIYFSMEKNIFIRFSHITILSILLVFPLSPILRPLFELPDIINWEVFAGFLIACFPFSFFITYIIYHLLLPDYLGNFAYFIKHETYGKLYIIKSINRKEILLYSHPRLTEGRGTSENDFSIILLKDDVKKMVIYREKYNVALKSLKKLFTPIMFFKNR
ncbi:TPA: hypothetical protein QC285_005399 [Bacillus cereus]|uniref:Uncharacterized protein n=1 Tax=Bacillus thuringiensis TaxID=1428 RepID=A0A9X6U413_BACTU|nr:MULTISPECIES: hypothetical protein [Bacillus cereus group]PED15892.1 hypothetical protein CON01_01775 [Bacillus thuringiensis]PGR39913.1 hypothetical protein COC47_09850 [Bacillus cereus]HDR8188339.1 hypothetical protein [Bacillus cereus]HDR8435516.1 hypothetical protein [Bacillus cereus]